MSIEISGQVPENIIDVLGESFQIGCFEEMSGIAAFFGECFLRGPSEYKTPHLDRNQFLPRTADENFLGKYHNRKYWIGVDLPFHVRKAINKDNVLILAEDPLRNQSDNLLSDLKEKVLLSTPFATHLEHCRTGRLKQFWCINECLLNRGYNVYLTDIHKLWIKIEGKGQKEQLPADFCRTQKAVLLREIGSIQPKLIITYGNTALEAFDSMKAGTVLENIPLLQSPHPSGTAKLAGWRDVIEYPTLR